MTATLDPSNTTVPLRGGEEVTIEPQYPWPSAYRGSKYSILHSRKHSQRVMAWQYDDLQIYVEPPEDLVRAMKQVGKSNGDGTGSIRITAAGEVLTKVKAENYEHSSLAPASGGWVPVYLGQLNGDIGFTDIDIQPDLPSNPPIQVWEGLPWHHGERWAVGVDNKLIWKWQGYRFYSAFDHSELIQRYREYRDTPGRLYVNEYGHIWANIPPGGVPSDRREEVNSVFEQWRRRAQANDKTSVLRLVNRRLKSTGGGDSSQGHLPIHLGHISDFDDGVFPRTVVDDTSYFGACGRERDD